MNTLHFERQLRQLTSSFAGAVLGGLIYAIWAVAVNWDAGPAMALRAGTAHWLMSTFLTYYGTALMRVFFDAGSQALDGAILAMLGGLAFTYSVLIGVHHAIGTPHLALTLAAGVIPNLLFCGGYSLLLLRTARVEAALAPRETGA